jgi:hypothetical protein
MTPLTGIIFILFLRQKQKYCGSKNLPNLEFSAKQWMGFKIGPARVHGPRNSAPAVQWALGEPDSNWHLSIFVYPGVGHRQCAPEPRFKLRRCTLPVNGSPAVQIPSLGVTCCNSISALFSLFVKNIWKIISFLRSHRKIWNRKAEMRYCKSSKGMLFVVLWAWCIL